MSPSSTKRQQEFLAGRQCALAALQQAGCKNISEIKTDLNRAPLWPVGFTGSISHTQDFTAAAVAPTSACRGLGIDAERILSDKTAVRIRDKILTVNEVALLAACDSLDMNLGVGVIFSAKESLYKALNPLTQTFFGFQEAEAILISHSNPHEGEMVFRLLTRLSKEFDIGCEITARFKTKNLILTAVEIPPHSI